MTPRLSWPSFSLCVVTFMPAATGVVHDAGKPFMPSICTRQRRHEPNASRSSVAQSFGIVMPASDAARSTEVPAGTRTSTPSIVSATVSAEGDFGVPKSDSAIERMAKLLLRFRHSGEGRNPAFALRFIEELGPGLRRDDGMRCADV